MKNVKLQTNLLKQNCYLRDTVPISDVKTKYSDSTYLSVDEVTTSSGVELKYSEVPYEITPESVNSYASSDYHVDLNSAIANGNLRRNLGDIRDYQKVCNMDTASALAHCQMILSAIASQTSNSSSVSVNGNNSEKKSSESEVNNNV